MKSFDSGLVLEILLTLWSIYTASVNFFQKRISNIGLDAFFLYLMWLLSGKKDTSVLRKDSRFVQRMGVIMLIVSIGGIWDMILSLIEMQYR